MHLKLLTVSSTPEYQQTVFECEANEVSELVYSYSNGAGRLSLLTHKRK